MGGKIMSKLAPRLIFFQYSNLVNNELDNKKRHYRLHQIRSYSEWLIQEVRMKKYSTRLGLSELNQPISDSDGEANILTQYEKDDFF